MSEIFAILLKYWKPIVIILIMIALYGSGFHSGKKTEKEAWQLADAKRIEAEQKQTIADQEKVLTTEHSAHDITNEVSNAYESKITFLDNLYANAVAGVRAGAGAPTKDNLSKAGKGTGGLNETSCVVSDRFRQSVRALKYKVQKQTEQLIFLQTWETQQQALAER